MQRLNAMAFIFLQRELAKFTAGFLSMGMLESGKTSDDLVEAATMYITGVRVEGTYSTFNS